MKRYWTVPHVRAFFALTWPSGSRSNVAGTRGEPRLAPKGRARPGAPSSTLDLGIALFVHTYCYLRLCPLRS
jgi:hypothetical protein